MMITMVEFPFKKPARTEDYSITGHSRFVKRAKLSIIALTMLMLITLLVWPMLRAGDDEYQLTFTDVKTGDSGETALMNPRFYGVDGHDRPYTVLADKAEEGVDKTVYLTTINADLHLEDGTWVAVIADRGQLEPNKRYLHLIGNVNILADSGYDLLTERALIDLELSEASSNEEVFVQTTSGNLRADGFRFSEHGENLRFVGNVKTIRQEGLFDPEMIEARKAIHKSRLASSREGSAIERRKTPTPLFEQGQSESSAPSIQIKFNENAKSANEGKDVPDFAWREEEAAPAKQPNVRVMGVVDPNTLKPKDKAE